MKIFSQTSFRALLGTILLGTLIYVLSVEIEHGQSQSTVAPKATPATQVIVSLPKPVKRIIYDDNTCAGVVRADGSADGECPPESANLPTIHFNEVLPPGRIARD